MQWRASVNTVMKLGFNKENMLLFVKLSNYQLFKEYPASWIIIIIIIIIIVVVIIITITFRKQ
jgi:hypothetical protein